MKSIEVFQKFVPPAAAEYCNTIYETQQFEFKIKKARLTKLGDFRYNPKTQKHTITINNNLNPYNFLVTYLHEIAHLHAFRDYGQTIMPHGEEWKEVFKEVSKPTLKTDVFPKEVLTTLNNYFKNPKASSCSDPVLYQVLRKYDNQDGTVFLKSLKNGQKFEFNNRAFIKLETKRTRSLCKEMKSGRKYMISELAQVKLL